MIHECDIENEPAELLVGRTRPVDGEAGAVQIVLYLYFVIKVSMILNILLITDCRLRLTKRLRT